MSTTRIAGAQIDVELGNIDANLAKVISHIQRASELGSKLVIFPECALTGYAFESLDEARAVAEPLNGPSADKIASACSKNGVFVIAGFIERADDDRCFNAAMVVGSNGPIGSYRKIHMPFIGADRFLTPGDRSFEVFDLPIGKIGILICYDTSFPEASRALKLLGAELIVLPTNWPPGARRNPEFVINTRAQENHVNYAAVDRIGTERGWTFIGRSKVVDFNGDTLGEASGDKEELLVADIDFREANNNRVVNVPGKYEIDRMADRRPELYEILTRPLAAGRRAVR